MCTSPRTHMEISKDTTLIPFDVETTGYAGAGDDFITTISLKHNDRYHIWLNTNGDTDVDAGEIRNSVIEQSGLDEVVLYVCDSERTLLQNFGEYVDSCSEFSDFLTSFEGETRQGTNDMAVPFMRTRCFANGLPWILRGVGYMDSAQPLSDKNRVDTSVEAEPQLEGMYKSDLKKFVSDMGFDIRPDGMNKPALVEAVQNNDESTPEMIASWARENNIYFTLPYPENFRKTDLTDFCEEYSVLQSLDVDSFTKIRKDELQEFISNEFQSEFEMWAVENFQIYPNDPSDLKVTQIKQYIDQKSLDIPYENMSKADLISQIRESDYNEEMLVEWHKEMGRDIGHETKSSLDSIHNVLVGENPEEFPVDVEPNTAFSPYGTGGDLVTGYKNQEYVNVILHGLEDVVRISNLTEVLVEYITDDDYYTKIL